MKKLLPLVAAFLLLTACGGNKQASDDWLRSNDIAIAVDKTFASILGEQFQQFALTHIEATMKPVYCSEDSAIRLLLADSLRSIVVTRKLTDGEKQRIRAAGHEAKQSLIASDAVALIVGKSNADTVLTLDEIRGIVSGRITRWEQLSHSTQHGELSLVFDENGSSTVRYMQDSLNGGRPLAGNVFAQGSNEAVIQTVMENQGVIGVVGVDWLRQGSDVPLSSFRNLPFNVVGVVDPRDEARQNFEPYQYYIYTGQYPLTRSLYVITTDPRERSEEKQLYFWLKGQKGQLIFCNNSQLLPMTQVQYRSVNIH